MTMTTSNTIRGAILAASVMTVALLCLAPGRADDKGVSIAAPQQAVLLFTNGQQFAGILDSLDSKKVMFRRNGQGASILYKATQFKAVQVADDVLTYNAGKGIFESAKALQAKGQGADKPADKAEPPKQADAGKPAAAPATQTVIAEGVGASADEALKDAFRAAVRQVVGAVVDAETLIKNDQIISDKVLTYSDGFVVKYDELSKKQDKGIFRVKINAQVERRSLVAKLKAANVTVKDVEGKDLAASALTRLEARENAAALISKELLELPKLLVAEARKPTAADYDEDKKELTVDVTVKVDMKKYADFTKRFTGLLDKVCLAKDSTILVAKVQSSNFFHNRENGDRNGEGPEWVVRIPQALSGPDLRNSAKGWCIWIVTNIDQQAVRTRWDGYVVDSDPHKTLSGLRGKIAFHLSLFDKDGAVVIEDETSLSGHHGNRSTPWLTHGFRRRKGFLSYGDGQSLFDGPLSIDDGYTVNCYVAPLAFEVDRLPSDIPYVPAVTYRRRIKITENELSKVKEFKCEVIHRPAAAKTE